MTTGCPAVVRVLAAAVLCVGASVARADDATAAQKVAEEFVLTLSSLENGGNPARADLYEDQARIVQVTVEKDGRSTEEVSPAPVFKKLIRQSARLQKLQPYTASYAIEGVETEGNRIRIVMQRHTEPGKFDSRVTMVIAQRSDGSWGIVEQITEFAPRPVQPI